MEVEASRVNQLPQIVHGAFPALSATPFISMGYIACIDSECLSRAIRNENPKLLMVASAPCLLFQHLLVSAVHTVVMEVEFAKRAVKNPNLKNAHNVHKLSSLLSGALLLLMTFTRKPHFFMLLGISTLQLELALVTSFLSSRNCPKTNTIFSENL